MGFRSTFITEDYGLALPQWFIDKWGDSAHFGETKNGDRLVTVLPISSKYEAKTYGIWGDLPEDIQRVMQEDKTWGSDTRDMDIVLIYLHECGGITRVEIHKDRILYSEPG